MKPCPVSIGSERGQRCQRAVDVMQPEGHPQNTELADPAIRASGLWRTRAIGLIFVTAVVLSLRGEIIGTNVPALPLTLSRIRQLPASDQSEWARYLERSQRQLLEDQNALRRELKVHGLTQSTPAPAGKTSRGLPLNREADWYGGQEARRIADIIVSYQTPAGGWSKNLDMTKHPRVPGEHFAADDGSRRIVAGNLDSIAGEGWDYVGTFDNNATATQLRFLSQVVNAAKPNDSQKHRTAFSRGLEYIFASQYPNGGWPQVWPLRGGYHDAVTFNDGAIVHVVELLHDITRERGGFLFVSRDERKRAGDALRRGVGCIVAAQVVTNGRRTAWGQQHDALTLQPSSARNYEMPGVASGESAGVLLFLLRLENKDSNVVAAINAAAAWFEKVQLHDVAFKAVGDDGRRLVASPGSGPVWSRYYELQTDRPVFGDRDKSIHDVVDELSRERRDGYSWFTDSPKVALEEWSKWRAARK